MSTRNQQCPVDGCGMWSSRWGRKHFPLPPPNVFSLQLANGVDVVVNNRICVKCYKCNVNDRKPLDGRTRVVPSATYSWATSSAAGIDTLIEAAEQNDPPTAPPPPPFVPPPPPSPLTLPSSSSFSHLSNGALLFPLPPPSPVSGPPSPSAFPYCEGCGTHHCGGVSGSPSAMSPSLPSTPVMATVVGPESRSESTSLPSPMSPPPPRVSTIRRSQSVGEVGSSMPRTRSPRSPITRSWTFASKQCLLKKYDAIPKGGGERSAWLVLANIPRSYIGRWREDVEVMVEHNLAHPTQRVNKKRRRHKGGGRRPVLGPATEKEIRAYILGQRRFNIDKFAHIVTGLAVLTKASLKADRVLSEHWLVGFLMRQRVSLRTVTSTKIHHTEEMQMICEEFRYIHRDLLRDKKRHSFLYNMDETAIYFDMVHDKTIDEMGARAVPAHQACETVSAV